MKKNNLHLYSIMPLDTEHLDEVCQDIYEQYQNGVADCVLFSMTLVPEGNPVIDKVSVLCKRYDQFREKLSAMGVPNGVLVQATIGHGYVLGRMFPYQRYVTMTEGKEEYIVCPYDEGFRDYIYHVMKTIASHNPDCIMVDDDYRLIFRDGSGCACPLHMKRFNELAHTQMTREELLEVILSGTEEGRNYEQIMIETQKEALVETARIMRAGIDSVNPSIPGSFCCVSNNVEFAAEITPILAGKGNPIVIRINNGNYTAAGTRYFSKVFFRAAASIAKLKGAADIILAETDTCPQNRYSTGAMSLHTHFTGSILEGVNGAKQWITRLGSYEPESGIAYRKILTKYRGFYQELADIVPTLQWKGCRIPVLKTPKPLMGRIMYDEEDNAWATCVLERLGIPMYFSGENGGVLCLEGNADQKLTDQEIMEALKGTVILASDSADNLIRRGFGAYLGVEVREWKGAHPGVEILDGNGSRMSCQMGIRELVPVSSDTRKDSTVYHTMDCALFPGTTIYQNTLGGTVIVFCGTPKAEFLHTQAFSFLNYTRKLQLIHLLEQTSQLPVYYPNDEEIYFKAAVMPDGGLFCAVINLGFDPIEQLELVCRENYSSIQQLMPDGSRKELTFSVKENRYVLDTSCVTLNPVILFLNETRQ